jgi:hypothetical protein
VRGSPPELGRFLGGLLSRGVLRIHACAHAPAVHKCRGCKALHMTRVRADQSRAARLRTPPHHRAERDPPAPPGAVQVCVRLEPHRHRALARLEAAAARGELRGVLRAQRRGRAGGALQHAEGRGRADPRGEEARLVWVAGGLGAGGAGGRAARGRWVARSPECRVRCKQHQAPWTTERTPWGFARTCTHTRAEAHATPPSRHAHAHARARSRRTCSAFALTTYSTNPLASMLWKVIDPGRPRGKAKAKGNS